MLRPTAIGYDAPSHYGGWGITINFPEDFPRSKTVKRIRETKDKCLYSDYHPCEYTYVLWQKEFASGLRGRTYFIATWSSLFWLIFVVGVKEWK